MAETVSVSHEITAAPGQVWTMLSDVTRMGEWSPETTSCHWRKGATGPTVGAKFRGVNQRGRRRWFTDCEVTESIPGEVFAFRVTAGGLRVATWRFELEPTAGGCRVTEQVIDQRGWLITNGGRLVSGVADRAAHNRAGMERTLAALAITAEQEGAST